MAQANVTPVIHQYLSIKKKYPDAILFFRMGDFYEMFFEDAKKASKILEITLTSRNKKNESPVPMCGVPFRAAQGYLARLIEHGCKVAICDQLEDASKAKGIVKRDVVRVVTPGMIVEDTLLDGKTNNYVMSLSTCNNVVGISCLDISTGTFRVSETIDFTAATNEIHRVSPSEIIMPENSKNDWFYDSIIDVLPEKSITLIDKNAFELEAAREILTDQFQTLSLQGFGCEHLNAGICAAGALIYYVRETQKQKVEHLTNIETYFFHDYLLIDDLTCRNLELFNNLQAGNKQGTLIDVLDCTITSMGGRLLKQWLRYPLMDIDKINSRLNAVEESKERIHLTKDIRKSLSTVYDIERLGNKISMGHSNARDLVALKRSLQTLPGLWSYLSDFEAHEFQQENHFDFEAIVTRIESAIREDAPLTIHDGGLIKPGYSKDLDELVSISQNGKKWIADLEAQQKQATGINSLKVGYNKVFGYYIEVPKTRSMSVPDNYIRKQTLVNAERYITDELKQFEYNVLGAHEKRTVLEYELFDELRSEITEHNLQIQKTAKFIAKIDCIISMAYIADQNHYKKPHMNHKDQIIIEEGRHPVVEKLIAGERFVPNDITINNQTEQVLVITGPNMAGKSTILRQTALIVLMAQMGSFVPVKKASLCITDKIFTRIGALDNLSSGQSTFLVEMQETANILNNSTSKSLVILDEIGRGTSTFDGLSIAWAVAEYLHDLRQHGVKSLFATHYHELTELAQTKPKVKNYNVAVKEWNDEIIFLRKLVPGGTNRSYGIQVARLAGVPGTVIERAKKILFDIENDTSISDRSHVLADKEAIFKKGHQQLDLFRKAEHVLIDRLKKIDISKMTPLEALNYLNQLKEQAENVYF
jgi:DNA mismatch repair protein MutS